MEHTNTDTRALDCAAVGNNHSDDTVEVWHGRPTPATMCGYHFTFHSERVYRAMRNTK